VERRTRNLTRWRDADMVQRWVASAWLLTEKHFRRIDGHAHLWALAAVFTLKKTPKPSNPALPGAKRARVSKSSFRLRSAVAHQCHTGNSTYVPLSKPRDRISLAVCAGLSKESCPRRLN